MKKKKTRSRQKISKNISELKRLVGIVAQYEKQYKREGVENPDAYEFHVRLFETVEWLIENDAYNDMLDIQDDMSDDEIEIIDSIIDDVVYRFEYFVKDNEGVVDSLIVTPFAIPMMITVPIEYKEDMTSVKELPRTIDEVTEAKLLRNCMDFGNEPSILFDKRLWKNDETGWYDFGIVMKYLRGIVANVSNLIHNVPSLEVYNKKSGKYKKEEEYEEVEEEHEKVEEEVEEEYENRFMGKQISVGYILTRTITGVVISEDVNIDEKLFGYEDNGKGIVKNHFTHEFAIYCESELTKKNIKNVKVQPLSLWPVELWEVPETVICFIHSLKFRQRAYIAACDNPYNGKDRMLEIVLNHVNNIVMNIRLLVYDEHSRIPFFVYTWKVEHEFETPDFVIDSIARICREELGVNKVSVVKEDIAI